MYFVAVVIFFECQFIRDDVFVVVVIYFLNVNLLLIIYFAAGAFSLDQPGWLLRYVLCQQCWLGGLRFSLFPFSCFCFLPRFIFLLQGQPGQEDGGGVHADPGFRSVGQKTLLVILFFHYQHHFDLLVCQSCHKIVFNLVAPRFPLNDAGRSIVAALAARILEDPQGPGFIRWTWPPIGMVGGLGVDTKSCLFTS